ncbi:MAG TPA: hypothetical protein VL096_06010 [Pirellulaceae bacterium]|nr:hypothetical protein [Pirellulaceae bacterium]
MRLGWLLLIGCLIGGTASAQEAASDSGLSDLVTNLVRANLPHDYEKKKNWGQQIDVLDGWHVSMDGIRVKTKRKWKPVNHGTWTMYHILLTRPEELQIRVTNIRPLEDGRAGFDAEFSAPLEIFGRLSEWQRGVQLISLSADCEARVRLQTTCAVRMKLDLAGKRIPDVLFEPEVLSATLTLDSFRLHRLSQLHGPLAKHLGTEAREIIEDELAERNADLPAKFNKQIAKQQDKLRLPLSSLADTKFGDLTSLVPKP